MPRQIITNRTVLALGGQNLTPYSSKLDEGINNNAPITLNQYANPLTGATTMDLITDDATNGFHRRLMVIPSLVAFQQYTASALMKNLDRRYAGFQIDSGSNNTIIFDLTDGSVVLTNIASQMLAFAGSAELVGDSTYRVKVTFTPRINIPLIYLGVIVHDQATPFHFYAGDGKGVYVDQLQINRGNNITSHAVTTGSVLNNPVRARAVRNLI